MKIYVSLYLDHNLGDDLFLDYLLKKYPEIEFSIGLSSRILELNPYFEKYRNLKKIEPISLKRNLIKINEFDAFVLIGGSIFQDLNYKLYKSYISRALFFYYLKRNKIPGYIMGSNLGPFKTILGGYLFRKTIENSDYTCVRDEYSYNLLKKWKIKSKYELAPDIIFSYPNESTLNLKEFKKNLLGISIINTKLNLEVKENYIKKMIELIENYLKKSDQNRVRLLGFDGGHENDEEVIQEILNRLKEKSRVETYTYSPKIMLNEFLEKFLECEFIVCNRFHSLVLALKFNRRIFPIIYSKKTLNVLKDIKYPYEMIDYAQIENLNVNDLIKDIENKNKKITLELEYMKKSKLHFKGIDDFVKETLK